MADFTPKSQILGFLFTSAAGTCLHFLFDLTGQSLAAALVSAVNESIWEHMKLIFVPMFLVAGWQYRSYREPDFWCRKMKSILIGLILIPVLYYTYTGILGVSADWFNVTIFFLAAGAAYRWEALAVLEGRSCRISDKLALTILILIAGIFAVLTFYPPEIPFFRDPITGTYGYIG